MRLRVRVKDRTYEVEVGDLHARPIPVMVEGEPFEVWPEPVEPEPQSAPKTIATAEEHSAPPPRPSRRTSGEAAAPRRQAGQTVYAPIPGIIDSVAVNVGDTVRAGQELCVLEAMKMKNVIRATRSGEIAKVCVTPGQHVRHNDPLLEYAR
ncbi:MAG: acetyl-CoA carboxylase biotin carboxyl carrier protein subunit [Anaerolineae bacterium]|jgi:biotin carboxyl carrier protein